MAPNTYANADHVYRQAYNRLRIACTLLERHLPPPEGDEQPIPPLRPIRPQRPRLDSVAQCALCRVELEAMNTGDRGSHACTHQPDGQRHDDETRSAAGSTESNQQEAYKVKRDRQPNSRVIRQDMIVLDDKFDAFTVAFTTLSSHLDEEEAMQYDTHLLVWAEFYGWMKDRAENTMKILDSVETGIPPDRTRPSVNFHTLGTTYTVVGSQASSDGINQGAGTSKETANANVHPTMEQNLPVDTERVNTEQVNIGRVSTEQVNTAVAPSIVTVPDSGTGS